MATAYDMSAATAGEVRLYLNAAGPVDVERLRSALAYGYAYQRDHRVPTDPWDYALGDARTLESEAMFDLERDRILHILSEQIPNGWEADLLYYPQGRSSPLYHWSSAEGTLHPIRTVFRE